MRFVKFESNSAGIIASKEYKIEFEAEKEICFIDEDGEIDVREKTSHYFEIIDRPVMVKAWYDDVKFSSRELIQDLGESFKFRYLCRNTDTDEIAGWENIEYIKYKPKKVKELNEIDSLKEDVNLLKGQVSEILRLLNEKI